VTDNSQYRQQYNSTLKIMFEISNKNDKPQFACDQEPWSYRAKEHAEWATTGCLIRVSENTPANTVIGTVLANDPEGKDKQFLNQTITYTLRTFGDFAVRSVWDTNRAPDSECSVANTTDDTKCPGRWVAEIVLMKNSLDFESQSRYKLELAAEDDGVLYDSEGTISREDAEATTGYVVIEVVDQWDPPFIGTAHDEPPVRTFGQHGLMATSGGEKIQLSGSNLGATELNCDTCGGKITARYGKGQPTVHARQVVTLQLADPSSACTVGDLHILINHASTWSLCPYFNASIVANGTLHPSVWELGFKGALLNLSSVESVLETTVESMSNSTWAITVDFGLTATFAGATPVESDSDPLFDWGQNVPTLVLTVDGTSAAVITRLEVADLLSGRVGYFNGDAFAPERTPLNARVFQTSDLQCVSKDVASDDPTAPYVGTRVECLSAMGYGTDHLWQLEVHGHKSNIAGVTTSYARPAILAFTGDGATEAVTDGGEQVFISGTQFGTQEHSAITKITFGPEGSEYEVQNYSIVEDHIKVLCIMEPGKGGALKWIVTGELLPPLSYPLHSLPSLPSPFSFSHSLTQWRTRLVKRRRRAMPNQTSQTCG
jgi:hypothetical protein